MKLHKGVYYFSNYDTARSYARKKNIDYHKIVCYELGWAIQIRCSGPYVGE